MAGRVHSVWPLLMAGFSIISVGLFIFAGHSEIELRGTTLCAIERCGLLRWKWTRSTFGLRRFFVSERLELMPFLRELPTGPLVV